MYAFALVMISVIRQIILRMFKHLWRMKSSSIIRNNSFQYVNQSESLRICVRNVALEFAAISKLHIVSANLHM